MMSLQNLQAKGGIQQKGKCFIGFGLFFWQKCRKSMEPPISALYLIGKTMVSG